MVFQAFAVWPHLSVYENVAFPLRIRKLPAADIDKRTRDALRSVNLLESAQGSPGELSGGGKQRVALARALAINPEVMLLDEPLSSLDPHLRGEMRFEIKELQKQYGFSIVYVTHDQSEAMALSDRILVMKLGVAQQVDSPLNVYTKPANKFVFSFIGLSSFLNVLADAEGARTPDGLALPPGLSPPQELRAAGGFLSLAVRPSEIEFRAEGGLRGVVTRRSFLGELVDYQVRIGGQHVRVQKGRHAPGPDAGDSCGLHFLAPHWYGAE
jgi:iron(III) transport system ATP-binding protein